VYNTRASWAMVNTGLLANEPELVRAARRNLDWALTQQTPCGWFGTNASRPDKVPSTHVIAYAIRGFLESGLLLAEERYLAAGLLAAFGIARAQRADGWLAGTYSDGWQPRATYSCLTGLAQMSLNWMRLGQDGGRPRLRENARRAIDNVKRSQRIDTPHDAVRGGIAGSSPIWGAYARFEYPNWAAKFFVDALMMDMEGEAITPVATRFATPIKEIHG